MSSGKTNPTKALYQKLRLLAWEQLWEQEVPRFDRAGQAERTANVALVRAVGVVFSESGDPSQKDAVAQWLRGLLKDPEEKIRRYAMAAIPKIGAGRSEEADLLNLLQKTRLEREKKFLARSLDKIGGTATLDVLGSNPGLLSGSGQKVKASVAREFRPGRVRLDRPLKDAAGIRIHLRSRRGLEEIVRDEVVGCAAARELFRVVGTRPGTVMLEAVAPFSLGDLYALRCFWTAGFVLGSFESPRGEADPDAIAAAVTSPLARRSFESWTDGPARYRLEFVGRGHQRGAVREIAERAFALCPAILNDARSAPWAVDIYSSRGHVSVELRPRLVPDPRFAYRRDDVPAASHPPLAACMARLAGPMRDGILWDPFCGSGLELIERSMLGGVRIALGSDRSAEAVDIARDNFAASGVPASARFACCDFRDFARAEGLAPESISQIITNPPLGRRVPIVNLPGLIRDLFGAADALLAPGGSLVFANPVALRCPFPSLRLMSSRTVDFGGFDCRLEHYSKSAPLSASRRSGPRSPTRSRRPRSRNTK